MNSGSNLKFDKIIILLGVIDLNRLNFNYIKFIPKINYCLMNLMNHFIRIKIKYIYGL
jgi:hypothetical protein